MAKNLANLIVPSVASRYITATLEATNKVVLSGAAVNLPALSGFLAGGAAQFNLPYWKTLSATGLTPSTDVDVAATAQRMAAGNQTALRVVRSITPVVVSDLEAMLIGEDPVAEAATQIANIHNRIRQKTLLDVLAAVTAVDSADAGADADLLYAGTPATSFSPVLLASAIATIWGDQGSVAGNTLFMNSLTMLGLQLGELAAGLVLPSEANLGVGSFAGNRVIVDDAVPAKTVYVVRPGGLAFGTAALANPFAVTRKEEAGNGGGADFIYSRDLYTYHVAGTSFSGAFTVGAELATDGDIADSAKWTLVQDRKFCGAIRITYA